MNPPSHSSGGGGDPNGTARRSDTIGSRLTLDNQVNEENSSRTVGRPKGTVKLDGQSLRFALFCAEGMRPGLAVKKAGYRVKPGALMRKPHIAEAIRVLRLLDAELRRIIGASLEG